MSTANDNGGQALSVLYRGPLSSCNFGCGYCPFAKTQNTRQELSDDASSVERFVQWVGASHRVSGVFFTPWGEALIRPAYQEALVDLSHMPHVHRAAIQTNLSGDLRWIGRANAAKVALWATWHPEWAPMSSFVAQCEALAGFGVRFSVGVVGFPRFQKAIASLRGALPDEVYLWVNAVRGHCDSDSSAWRKFVAIDPLFELNTRRYISRGRPCSSGHSVISVDGAGRARRCHFVSEELGNIYGASFWENLSASATPCPASTCHCHIGYVHMPDLKLNEVFGQGVLERIPQGWPGHVEIVPSDVDYTSK